MRVYRLSEKNKTAQRWELCVLALTNEGKSKTWYRCTKRHADIKCPSTAVYCIETAQILKQIEEHNHSSSIVEQFVCEKQNTLIWAAVDVGNSSCNRVSTVIKTVIDKSLFQETLRQAIFREKQNPWESAVVCQKLLRK